MINNERTQRQACQQQVHALKGTVSRMEQSMANMQNYIVTLVQHIGNTPGMSMPPIFSDLPMPTSFTNPSQVDLDETQAPEETQLDDEETQLDDVNLA